MFRSSMPSLPQLDSVPAAQREGVRQFATRLQQYAGSQVHCLVLYGPIARGDFDPRHDTVRSALVLDGVDLNALRKLAAEGHQFGRWGIGAPLVLTPAFLRESRDTYPLELLDIQQQHLLILGEDLFAPLQLDAAHVRLQCERELKVLGLSMRQAVVAHGATERSLRRAAWPSLLGLLRILRGLCWLHGHSGPIAPLALVGEAEAILGQPLDGIRHALQLRGAADWGAIQGLYHDLETLGQAANGW